MRDLREIRMKRDTDDASKFSSFNSDMRFKRRRNYIDRGIRVYRRRFTSRRMVD
jgi:hypothetical protein